MAIFGNNLTFEEQEAGFNTTEADNDAFSLEQIGGEYPAEVLDNNSDAFINSMAENNENIDLMEDDIAAFDLSEEAKKDDEIENMVEDFQEEENSTTETNENIETINLDSNMEQDDNVIDSNKLDAEEVEVEFQNENDANISQDSEQEKYIAFDDDFLNMLKNDIEKTPVNKSKLSEDEQAGEEVIKFGSSIDADFSKGEEEFNADLISMEMETKVKNKEFADADVENYDADEILPELDIPSPPEMKHDINENQINADNKTETTYIPKENMTEEEKQNNKKTFALIVAVVSVAMILVVGGVIGYFYLNNKQNIPAEQQNAEQKDSVPAEKIITEQIDTTIADTNAVEEIEDTAKTPAIVQQPAREPKTVQQPRTPVAKKAEQQKPIQDKGSLYTIQIYSSPVRTDAEKRLSMLNQRGID